MASNKHLIEDKSSLLKNKLQKIADNLDRSINSGQFQTQEQFITEAAKVLNTFYKDLTEPLFEDVDVLPDSLPDPELYNRIWNNLIDDLVVLFEELENVESLTLANFNFLSTETNRLLSRLKLVSSQLGDFTLYATDPTKDAVYFKDSFNDLSKIESASPFLNSEECSVGQDEGIITLPVDTSEDSLISVTELPVINPSSNGTPGNNQELNAAANSKISAILDDNPDTWFEFERVVNVISDTDEPLILDITINVGEPKPCNFIRINPNNFGTKSPIAIETIETSLDGKVFTSIKDDIPVQGLSFEDEENIFLLAPATSKFAGQGIYTFTPRKIKYVRLVLKQAEAYAIDTNLGPKFRYAIGIRDVNLRGIIFKNKGEIVSKPFNLSDEVRKVSIETNQAPSNNSDLLRVDYEVSPDAGLSWHPISAIQVLEPGESTVLNFNGPEEGAIFTPLPITSLRIKTILSRNDEAFRNGGAYYPKTVLTTSELHQVPTGSPFEFSLTRNPIQNSIDVIDPEFGSKGFEESPYVVSHGGSSTLDIRRFLLPFAGAKRPFKKVLVGDEYEIQSVPTDDWINVKVGGETWSHATKPLDEYTASGSLEPTFYLYTFSQTTGHLFFGNGRNTAKVPSDAPISMYFEPERIFPSHTEGLHVAKLEYKASSSKKSVKIEAYDQIQAGSFLVPRWASIIRLPHSNITDTTDIVTALATEGYSTQKNFVNGADEISATTDWSIDTDNGVIYLGSPTDGSSSFTLEYQYQPITKLREDEWEWNSQGSLRDSIRIKDTAWKLLENKDLSISTTNPRFVFELEHGYVVRDTIEFNLLDVIGSAIDDDSHLFLQEVEFIDGRTELGIAERLTRQYVSKLTPNSSGIATITLDGRIINDTKFGIVKGTKLAPYMLVEDSALDDVGDYSIDRDPTSLTYRQVQIKMPSNQEVLLPEYIRVLEAGANGVLGAVSGGFLGSRPETKIVRASDIGYYTTRTSSGETQGLYSVNYETGTIYTQRELTQPSWSMSVSYKYTDYRVSYKIARRIPPEDYQVDVVNNIIRISDEEILDKRSIPKDSTVGSELYYQVDYDYVGEEREDITDLISHFSPVLKDYSLKVITKGKLI